jgi:hypothetical protein
MDMRRSFLVHVLGVCCSLTAFAISFTAAYPALANGRFPAANHLVERPGHPEQLLLRTTFGFLYSFDRGQIWDWVCEKAFALPNWAQGQSDPAIALLASGTTLAGMTEGISVSGSNGCGWTVQRPKDYFVDVAISASVPGSAVAITGSAAGNIDGGTIFDSRVLRTNDDGVNWTAVGTPLDPTLIVETIDIAPSDPSRLYVSAIRGEIETLNASLLVSSDSGATWTEYDVPLDKSKERAPFIAAVDPTDPDRVYVRTSGPLSSRLLVTNDAGKSFNEVFSGGRMLGFALSPDGKRVFVGGPSIGVQTATTDNFRFEQRSTKQVECLMANASSLYACSNEANGFLVGVSSDNGATFKDLLHFDTIRGPLACGGSDGGYSCENDWKSLQVQLNIVPASDAGKTDASAPSPPTSDSGANKPSAGDAADDVSGVSASGVGCNLGGTSWVSLVPGGLALTALLGLRRASRKRPGKR